MIDVTAKSAGFILYSLLAQPKFTDFNNLFIDKFSTEKFLFSKTLPSVYFIPYANFHAITISNDLHIINQQIMFRYTYYEQ